MSKPHHPLFPTQQLESLLFHIKLLGGIPTPLEKYEFVNGKDDIPFMKWKIKAMFETTNLQRTAGIFKRSGLFFAGELVL